MMFDVDGGKILEGYVFRSKLQSSKDDDRRLWVCDYFFVLFEIVFASRKNEWKIRRKKNLLFNKK